MPKYWHNLCHDTGARLLGLLYCLIECSEIGNCGITRNVVKATLLMEDYRIAGNANKKKPCFGLLLYSLNLASIN
jgi:hypothetical protein